MKNEQFGFSLYEIPYIKDNKQALIEDSRRAVEKFKRQNNSTSNNITWNYKDYNIFSLANGSVHYYQVYKGLVNCIRDYFEEFQMEHPDQLWMQSWINFHKPGDLLPVHSHQWKMHGYLSIEPKETHTVFVKDNEGKETLYAVKNQVGQVYIGPGFRPHYVQQLADFDSERITLGFDLEMDRPSANLGLIPIVI